MTVSTDYASGLSLMFKPFTERNTMNDNTNTTDDKELAKAREWADGVLAGEGEAAQPEAPAVEVTDSPTSA